MAQNQSVINLKCYQKVLCNILKAGAVPNHVGFIMDGNRRHAKKNKLGSTHKGHVQGSKTLQRCLLMSKQVGIKQLSFFCFSVQNFNRSKEQVDKIMQLTLQLFDQNSNMMKILIHNSMRVHLIGRIQMIRQDVRASLQRAQFMTKQFNNMVVNFCFAYDSKDQIQKSISEMKQSSYNNFMQSFKIFRQGLNIPDHLDILVRTSNQRRLSNFMLAQCAYAYICILKQNWPELNLISFFKIVFWYNYHHKDIMKNRTLVMNKMKQCNTSRTNTSVKEVNSFEEQQQERKQLLKKQI